MTDEEIWQSLAQEARARAAAETNPDANRTLLEIANRYDRLAQLPKGLTTHVKITQAQHPFQSGRQAFDEALIAGPELWSERH